MDFLPLDLTTFTAKNAYADRRIIEPIIRDRPIVLDGSMKKDGIRIPSISTVNPIITRCTGFMLSFLLIVLTPLNKKRQLARLSRPNTKS